MIDAGFESDALYQLSGERAPYDYPSVDRLFELATSELSLPTVETDKAASRIWVSSRLRRAQIGELSGFDALASVQPFADPLSFLGKELHDFWLLYLAFYYEDQAYVYRPDTWAGNVSDTFVVLSTSWLDAHRLDQWNGYEWLKGFPM